MYKIQAKERITAFLRTSTHLSNLFILGSKLRRSFPSRNGIWISANAPGDAAWQLEDPICNLNESRRRSADAAGGGRGRPRRATAGDCGTAGNIAVMLETAAPISLWTTIVDGGGVSKCSG